VTPKPFVSVSINPEHLSNARGSDELRAVLTGLSGYIERRALAVFPRRIEERVGLCVDFNTGFIA
jgi:hypothetical protein